MSEQTQQQWRIEIGQTGVSCQIFLNGKKLTNVQKADLHLEAGDLSTLHLQFASYGRSDTDNTYPRRDDMVVAEGTPMLTSFEIAGQWFSVINHRGKTWLAHRLHGLLDRWNAMADEDESSTISYRDAGCQLERILERNGLGRGQQESDISAGDLDEGLFGERRR